MPQENEKPESKLDDLLNKWDEKKVDPNMSEVLTRLGKLEEENKDLRTKADATEKATKESDEAASYKADIAPVIKTLKADINASDEYVEEWINTEGRTNKKLASAWDNRDKEPEALDKIIEELIPKFKEKAEKEAMSILNVKPEELKPDDDNADNADRQASRASRIARNANNGAGGDDYDDVEWSGLSGHDFAVKSQKVFADMRSGKLKPE